MPLVSSGLPCLGRQRSDPEGQACNAAGAPRHRTLCEKGTCDVKMGSVAVMARRLHDARISCPDANGNTMRSCASLVN
jgi:hypothetical protein